MTIGCVRFAKYCGKMDSPSITRGLIDSTKKFRLSLVNCYVNSAIFLAAVSIMLQDQCIDKLISHVWPAEAVAATNTKIKYHSLNALPMFNAKKTAKYEGNV